MDEVVSKIYPSVQELSSVSSTIRCSQADCKAVFRCSSNLNMHLLKHHKIGEDKLRKQDQTSEYYCPIKTCMYHGDSKKCFRKLKYLKQHFLKVHASKKYECRLCEKKFSTETFRNIHARSCGKHFACTCGMTYNSSEAILTHTKRKGPGHTLVKVDPPKLQEENPGGCLENKTNRLIYPKLPIHYIAAIALSELSIPTNLCKAKSVAVQTDVMEMGVGERGSHLVKSENKKRKSSRQTQTTADKTKNLKISAETQTSGDYLKTKQKHYPKLNLPKKRKKSMETQTKEPGKCFKSAKGKNVDPFESRGAASCEEWFWKKKSSKSPPSEKTEVSQAELLDDLNFSKKEFDRYGDDDSFKNKNSVFYPGNPPGADQQMFDINRLCNIETQTEMDSFLTECSEDTSFTLCSTTETQTTDDFDSLLYSNMCTQTSEDVDQLFADFNFVDIETQTAWPDLSD